MRYEILFAPEAVEDYRSLEARVRAIVRDGVEVYLRHQPTRLSKSRIKRLRDLSRPQYRLRLGDMRVFYDVLESTVQIIAIVEKSSAQDWLEKHGEGK